MVSYFVQSIFSSSWKMRGDGGETKQCTLDMLNSDSGQFQNPAKIQEKKRERERDCVLECVSVARKKKKKKKKKKKRLWFR